MDSAIINLDFPSWPVMESFNPRTCYWPISTEVKLERNIKQCCIVSSYNFSSYSPFAFASTEAASLFTNSKKHVPLRTFREESIVYALVKLNSKDSKLEEMHVFSGGQV